MTFGELPPPVPQSFEAADTKPAPSTWRHFVAPVPVLDITKTEVEAVPVTAREVVVACVPVALRNVKFWKVEEAFTNIPPAMVVSPVFEIDTYVEVEVRASEEVPILNVPSILEISQCLASNGPLVSVIAKYGVVEAICNVQFGVVVPNPRLPLSVNLIHSVRVPGKFFVKKARTDLGVEVEISVNIDAMRAVEVAVVEA